MGEHSPLYLYLLYQWIQGNRTEAQLRADMAKGRLTQEELDYILAQPQDGVIPLTRNEGEA